MYKIGVYGLAALFSLGLAACSGGTSGAPAPPPPAPPPPPPPSGSVTISGSVTYDLVPLNAATNGLNYAGTTQRPSRNVVVEVADSSGAILSSALTNATGGYSFSVAAGATVRIQARARMQSPGRYDVTVRDNTSGNAIYVLQGSLLSAGSANSTRNLNAASGWGGAGYTGARAAAPFAILDTIKTAVSAIDAAAPGTVFATAQVYWSVNNRSASGSIANGEIGTTSFTFIGGVPTILVLGSADSDTDEYDRHVIAHEFGHFVESTQSRNDTIGGPHSLSQRLDPRLAFSEGWSNAFSGMALGDPVYRDSSGPQQSTGFSINIEGNAYSSSGWYGEGSVQSIVYDAFDGVSDGVDAISAGFGPVYRARLNPAIMINGTAPTTIFSYIEALKTEAGVSAAAVDQLRLGQNINGTGVDGAGETNDGGISTSLPVLGTLSIGAAPLVVCSVNDAGTPNKLGNRTLLRLPVPTPQTVTLTMTRISGDTGRDPDFIVSLRGVDVATGFDLPAETEAETASLAGGDHVVEAYDFFNINDSGPAGDSCYNLSAN
jgi:hypothetical protein